MGLATGRGLFITSAMLGAWFASWVDGVGGWIARCLLGRPFAANCVLIESPRAFFFDPGPDGGGESDLGANDELRGDGAGGFDTAGASVAPCVLAPGIGIVGLSGRGVLLHLLPCL